jgi:hypothetical protein
VELDPAPTYGTLFAFSEFPKESFMPIAMTHIPALLALIVGILILVAPRFLNYLVAVYLIIIGLMGLNILRF